MAMVAARVVVKAEVERGGTIPWASPPSVSIALTTPQLGRYQRRWQVSGFVARVRVEASSGSKSCLLILRRTWMVA